MPEAERMRCIAISGNRSALRSTAPRNLVRQYSSKRASNVSSLSSNAEKSNRSTT